MAQHNSKTPVNERDEWRTPPWLFRWLHRRFRFQMDMAASLDNALCDLWFTREENALGREWALFAQRGFCNPPYSDIDPWIDQAIAEMSQGFLTVMLFPSPNGEERFAPVFQHATEIIDIVGRFSFLRPDGTEVGGNTRGSSVYVFDPSLRGAPCRRWWVSRDAIRKEFE